MRQEYWSGLPLPPPGNLLDPGIELMSPANAGDAGSTPGSRRFPGGGSGNPLQYSCLMDRGVHGVAKESEMA